MSTQQTRQNGAAGGEFKDSLVVCHTSQGIELRATLMRLTRYAAVCEIHNPDVLLRNSEALDDFKIVFQEQTIYSGRAIVGNLIDAGIATTCELKLGESFWRVAEGGAEALQGARLANEFKRFFGEWQKLNRVSPEFKLAVGDMLSFLSDLRLWLEPIGLNLQPQASANHVESEREVLQELQAATLPKLALLFERFEYAASKIEKELESMHAIYAKRQLHPLVLCAPFMYRTFQKPLGYAGDYEMVNMMLRDPFEGGSLFAKTLNAFFLSTPPVVAHRNRIDFLVDMLNHSADGAARRGGVAKVLNLGCGPAQEVQRFLRGNQFANRADFTLLDFNTETIVRTQAVLEKEKRQRQCSTVLRFEKKSVQQIIKESGRIMEHSPGVRYDLIYCAGLFDYLTDGICKKLTSIFFNSVALGGTVVVTNVHSDHPSKAWMEYVVDWHLCYRDSQNMAALAPPTVARESVRVIAEPSGVNIMLELKKP